MATLNMNVQIESEQFDFLTRIGVDINTFIKDSINKRMSEESTVPPKKGVILGIANGKYRIPTDEEWEKMDEEILADFKEEHL